MNTRQSHPNLFRGILSLSATHFFIGVLGTVSNIAMAQEGFVIGVVLSIFFILIGIALAGSAFIGGPLMNISLTAGMFYSSFWFVAFVLGAFLDFKTAVPTLYTIPMWFLFSVMHLLAAMEPGINPANWKDVRRSGE